MKLESWSWILCDRSNGTQITTDFDLFTFIWPINPKNRDKNEIQMLLLFIIWMSSSFHLNATAFQRLWQNHKPVEGEFRWTSFFLKQLQLIDAMALHNLRHFRFYLVKNSSISWDQVKRFRNSKRRVASHIHHSTHPQWDACGEMWDWWRLFGIFGAIVRCDRNPEMKLTKQNIKWKQRIKDDGLRKKSLYWCFCAFIVYPIMRDAVHCVAASHR